MREALRNGREIRWKWERGASTATTTATTATTGLAGRELRGGSG
jgi:hypothetical protein